MPASQSIKFLQARCSSWCPVNRAKALGKKRDEI